jgi:hypothetical protein
VVVAIPLVLIEVTYKMMEVLLAKECFPAISLRRLQMKQETLAKNEIEEILIQVVTEVFFFNHSNSLI